MLTGKPDAGKLHVRFDEGEWQERHDVRSRLSLSTLLSISGSYLLYYKYPIYSRIGLEAIRLLKAW